MVIPANVIEAVNEGDVSAVVAWLDGGGDVNDHVKDGRISSDTLLMRITQADRVTSQHVEMARMLLRRGADVNYVPEENPDGRSALHVCVEFYVYVERDEDAARLMEIMGLYVDARANVNLQGADGQTPLSLALNSIAELWHREWHARRTLATASILLRNGASLDAVEREMSAEELLRRAEGHDGSDDEEFIACKALVADMRAAGGTWKQYVLDMPKALLRLRSLVARGRARSVKRLRARTPREIELLLAPAFPNELCWRVLEYWNPRYEARRTPSP